MTSWCHEYLSALRERDKKEKASQDLYSFYTKLADRTGILDSITPEDPNKESEPSLPPRSDGKAGVSKLQSYAPGGGETLARARQDLSEAQRSKGVMDSQLQRVTEELQVVKMQSRVDSRRLRELTSEKTGLVTKLRDRDEELQGKAKLLEDIHDETVSLTLQLNMAEEQSQKLKRENGELVDRWMARMGAEADAMNNASRFS